MTYKMNGYYRDRGGTVACVYGYDSGGHRVMIYKGYFNYKNNTVTLYPFCRLAPTADTVGKVVLPLMKLEREAGAL